MLLPPPRYAGSSVPLGPWVDRQGGDDRDLISWGERTSLLLPKSGRFPTSAANGGSWPFSFGILLPPPGYAYSFRLFGPWVEYDAADFTEFATWVENLHVSPPKRGR